MTTECVKEPRGILVQKFGGSSVATVDLVKSVARRVARQYRDGWRVAVVVSAMGKTTDELVGRARQITDLPVPREMDMLLHAGEIISSSLLAMAISEEGVPASSFTGFQAGMRTDGSHTEARILDVEGQKILRELERGRVAVIAGFQGASPELQITTLGRGGSDTSAIAIAAGIGADRCEILTDVDGIYTADPRIAPNARKMTWLSYDEMLEMATLGAKVLHSRSVEIARRFQMPFQVSSSFHETPGTWISTRDMAKEEFGIMEQVSIRGITHDADIAKVSLTRVPDRPGVAATIFDRVSAAGINMRLIVQAQSHQGTNDITFVIANSEVARLRNLTESGGADDLLGEVGGESVIIDDSVATVSVVGEGVHREPGIAATVFRTLADEGINIDLISTSNLMISCVVPAADLERGVRSLHATFFETDSATQDAAKTPES